MGKTKSKNFWKQDSRVNSQNQKGWEKITIQLIKSEFYIYEIGKIGDPATKLNIDRDNTKTFVKENLFGIEGFRSSCVMK